VFRRRVRGGVPSTILHFVSLLLRPLLLEPHHLARRHKDLGHLCLVEGFELAFMPTKTLEISPKVPNKSRSCLILPGSHNPWTLHDDDCVAVDDEKLMNHSVPPTTPFIPTAAALAMPPHMSAERDLEEREKRKARRTSLREKEGSDSTLQTEDGEPDKKKNEVTAPEMKPRRRKLKKIHKQKSDSSMVQDMKRAQDRRIGHDKKVRPRRRHSLDSSVQNDVVKLNSKRSETTCDENASDAAKDRKRRARPLRKKSSTSSLTDEAVGRPKSERRESLEMRDLKAKARSLRMQATGKHPRGESYKLDSSMNCIGADEDNAREMKDLKAKARSLRQKASAKPPPGEMDESDESDTMENNDVPQNTALKTRAISMLEKLGVSESSLLLHKVEEPDRKKHDSNVAESGADKTDLKPRASLRLSMLSDSSLQDDASISITEDFAGGAARTPATHEATAFERLSDSFSSLTSYFDGLKMAYRKDEGAESISSSIDSSKEKRHLLYLGQKSSDESMARMVLEDKNEWRKLQLQMKESGMITNGGTRQILNSLLDKAEEQRRENDEKARPPSVIFFEEASDEG